MNSNLYKRGYEKSPIIIIGDSLPKKLETRERIREILDRRHITYNSIIIPLKYYINDYLFKNYKGEYRLPVETKDDIFMYVNAIENPENKSGLNLDEEDDKAKINKLRECIFSKDRVCKYKIIICLGDFSYFAVRSVFNIYNKRETHRYPKKTCKYNIEKLGEYFFKEINSDEKTTPYILPILHNISNLRFEKTDTFIPESIRGNYVSYLQYIGESIAKVMMNDNEIKEYLEVVSK